MPIDKDTVSKVSNLARIKIDNNQLEKISKELEAVMGWIDSLSEVETSGIEKTMLLMVVILIKF